MKQYYCCKEADAQLPSEDQHEEFRLKCDCLPACTSIEYNANIDHVEFDETAVYRTHAFQINDLEYIFEQCKIKINHYLNIFISFFDVSSIQQTRLSIFFESTQVETVLRYEVYSFAEVLVICSGLLGLFLGISAISIIELLYYATLRIFWIIRLGRLETTAE